MGTETSFFLTHFEWTVLRAPWTDFNFRGHFGKLNTSTFRSYFLKGFRGTCWSLDTGFSVYGDTELFQLPERSVRFTAPPHSSKNIVFTMFFCKLDAGKNICPGGCNPISTVQLNLRSGIHGRRLKNQNFGTKFDVFLSYTLVFLRFRTFQKAEKEHTPDLMQFWYILFFETL